MGERNFVVNRQFAVRCVSGKVVLVHKMFEAHRHEVGTEVAVGEVAAEVEGGTVLACFHHLCKTLQLAVFFEIVGDGDHRHGRKSADDGGDALLRTVPRRIHLREQQSILFQLLETGRDTLFATQTLNEVRRPAFEQDDDNIGIFGIQDFDASVFFTKI